MMASGLLATLFPMLLLLGGLQPTVAPDAAEVAAVHAQLAAEIQPGGSFYAISYSQGQLEAALTMLTAMAEADENMAVVAQVPDFLREIGLFALRGTAASNLPRQDGRQNSRVFYAVDEPDQQKSYWKASLGAQPQDAALLHYLPADTALVLGLNADTAEIWSIVETAMLRFGLDGDTDALNTQLEQWAALSMPPQTLLSSMTGRLALGLDLDASAPIPVPIGTESLDLPGPGLIAVLEVNDNRFAQLLLQNLTAQMPPEQQTIGGQAAQVFTAPLPPPYALALCVVEHENVLILTTSISLMERALAAHTGQQGLPASEAFQSIIGPEPLRHHGLAFVNQSFVRAMNQLLDAGVRMAEDNPEMAFLRSLLQPQAELPSGGLIESNANGFRIRSVGSGMLARTAVSENPWSSTASVGMLAAIAIPSFIKARETAQIAHCRNNLRQIEMAREMWVLEHNRAPGDQPGAEDLLPYLDGGMPQCPEGGAYTITPHGMPPACSIPGHRLR